MKPQTASTPAMRILAGVLLVVGVLLTVGSLFADQLNLTGGGVGLGWKQLIGVVVGLVLALAGRRLARAAAHLARHRPPAGVIPEYHLHVRATKPQR